MSKPVTKDDISEYLGKFQYLQRACLGREGYVDISVNGPAVIAEVYNRNNELLLGVVIDTEVTTKADAKTQYEDFVQIIKKEGWV